MGNKAKRPELQIWRRDSEGGNSYTKISFSILAPNGISNPYIHEYTPNPPLEFQVGDILGVYTPNKEELVVYYQEGTGPVNYRKSEVKSASSTFTLVNSDILFDYPLVTVEISTGKQYLCKNNIIITNVEHVSHYATIYI